MRMLSVLLVFWGLTMATAWAGDVEYAMQGEPLLGYYVTPGGKSPLVILVHDWDGLTGYEKKRAEMLAAEGYAVFAVDLFGAGNRPTETAEKKQLTGALYQDRPRMRALLQAGLEAAGRQGADSANCVAMGYCFGGAAVLELARSGADCKGFVSFHGGLDIPVGQDYKAAKGKILVFHGTADASVSMKDFATLAETMEAQGAVHEMISYSGAPHAFTVFDTERYRRDADILSWQRFLAFLGETLR